MYELLKRKQGGSNEALVQFARQLVATPSPSFGEGQVADLIERQMQQIGYDRVERDEAGNVVGVMHGREAGPTLLLTGHMDTAWREEKASGPSAGEIRDGRLYGPGASDCKAGLAAQVHVGGLLKRSLLPLKGNLVVAATVAEEEGDSVGIRTLVQQTLPALSLRPDYAILGEPTSLQLYYGHDGWMELTVTVSGDDMFQVEDAANAICRDFEQLAISHPDDAPRRLLVHTPNLDEDAGKFRARIGLGRRLTMGEPVAAVMHQVQHEADLAAKAAGQVAVAVEVRQQTRQLYTGQTVAVRRLVGAWCTDPFHPLMERSRQALTAAGCQATAGKWRLGQFGAGTAGAVLVNEFHVPTVGYGPGDEQVIHAPGEFVTLDRLHTAVYGSAAIAHQLVGVPVFGWTSDEP